MTARTPFWPLLKNELGLTHFSQIVFTILVYWVTVGVLPLLMLFADADARGNIAALFDAGFLPVVEFMFIGALTLWVTYTTSPAFCELIAPGAGMPGAVHGASAFEFNFTRAVNRKVLFRAKTAAIFLFALMPFLINVAVSPFVPDLRFSPGDYTSPKAVQRHDEYVKAFPASHPNSQKGVVVPGQMSIPHGALAFTVWLFWTEAVVLLLLQAYGILVAGRIKSDNLWTALYSAGPIAVITLIFVTATRGYFRPLTENCENNFLFFAAHPLAMLLGLAALFVGVQAWCERRFSQLEII